MDIWEVRAFVYEHFADTTHAPSVDETAAHFNISRQAASRAYMELHDHHAFFLEPGTVKIRMASPFSGIPTDFRVHAKGKMYFASCAWEMLGLPVVLECDAVIDAVFTESNEAIQLEVREGKIHTQGGESNLLIHFPLPFSRWYDDLAFT